MNRIKQSMTLLLLILLLIGGTSNRMSAQTTYEISGQKGTGSIVVDGTVATVTILTDASYGVGGVFSDWMDGDGNSTKLDGVTQIKFVTETDTYLSSADFTCVDKLPSVTEIDASSTTIAPTSFTISISNMQYLKKLNLSKVSSTGAANLEIKGNPLLEEIDMKEALFKDLGYNVCAWDFSNNPELANFYTLDAHVETNSTACTLNFEGDEKLMGFDASFGAQTAWDGTSTPCFQFTNVGKLPSSFKYFISGGDDNVTVDVIQHGGLVDALGVLPTDLTYKKISVNGDLGDRALEHLNGFKCKVLDMGNATLETQNYTFYFDGNEELENIVLPKDIPSLKAEWFEGCTNLNAAISLSTDGESASAYVNKAGKLKTLTVESSLISATALGKIHNWTFSGTLKNVDIRPTHNSTINVTGATVEDGEGTGALGNEIYSFDLTNAVFEDDQMTFNQYQKYIKTVKMPTSSEMTKIPAYCMNGCSEITTLDIPGNYDILGSHAFEGMKSLNKVTLGPGVRTLEDHCFSMCVALTQVALPVGMTTVGSYSFDGCKALKDLMIPYGVKTIEEGAFYNLDALTSVCLPYTLKTIGKFAFKDCNKIESITIPENVTTIEEGAFALTNSLRDIYVLGKTAPTIVDYKPASGDEPAVEGSFDGMTLTNEYGTFNGTETTRDEFWRNKSEGFPLGKGAAFLHYPADCADQYTDVSRKTTYHAYLIDENGNRVKDEDGNDIRVPNNQDGVTATEWPAKYSGWKQFMLSVGNTTGDDYSSVWTVRHMYDDTWYTMCFPFDLTINQLVSTFGSGFEIAYFCGVEKSGVNIVLQFTESNYMQDADYSRVGAQANVPYMIHPNSGVGNFAEKGQKTMFVFTGVSPDYTNGPIGKTGYDYGGDAGTGPDQDTKQYDHSYTFIGSYGDKCEEGQYFVDKHNEYVDGDNPILQYQVGNDGNYKKAMPENLLVPRPIPENYYFLGLAKNATFPKFYRESRTDASISDMDNSTPDKTVKTGLWTRFTAMVKAKDSEGQAAKKSLGISIGDFADDTVITGINIIGANGQQKEYIDLSNKVYNLNGQVVKADASDLSGLPAGVYLVKGKKFVVR